MEIRVGEKVSVPLLGPTWTTTATNLEAGTVQDAAGQCLIIPQMAEKGATFPFAVTVGDCAQG